MKGARFSSNVRNLERETKLEEAKDIYLGVEL
jgi:hypothetical protein